MEIDQLLFRELIKSYIRKAILIKQQKNKPN